jgi:hypothetical protein
MHRWLPCGWPVLAASLGGMFATAPRHQSQLNGGVESDLQVFDPSRTPPTGGRDQPVVAEPGLVTRAEILAAPEMRLDLEFLDVELEAAFRTHRHEALVRWDRVRAPLGAVVTLVLTLGCRVHDHTPVLAAAGVALAFAELILAIRIKPRSEAWQNMRPVLRLIFKFVSVLNGLMGMESMPPPVWPAEHGPRLWSVLR